MESNCDSGVDIPREKLLRVAGHDADRQPMKRRALIHQAGFTLAEMMVSVLCFALAGGMVFLLLNSGMILYAKNMSVNTAHEDTRRSVNRLLRDIHAAVSVPQFIDGFNADGSLQVHSGTTAAAGVAFQLVAQGPLYVWKDPSASNLIMIYDGGSTAIAGQRLIVPLWGIEADITKTVTAGTANHSNLWIFDAQGNVVDQTSTAGKSPAGNGNNSNAHNNSNSNNTYAICYYTDRAAYIVQGNQLKLYYQRYIGAGSSGTGGTWQWVNPLNNNTNGVSIARDITSAKPFSPQGSTTAGVASINVVSGGSSYNPSTTVTISGGGGTGATATATVGPAPTKAITGVTVTNAGSGYAWAPTVTFSGGAGSGAAATVSLNSTLGTDDRYVHVTITATDPTFSNRNYKTTASVVDAGIPYRSRLCSIQ
jgi:hypothetical protein